MANSAIQTSFHSGEWAPALNARVDLAKYHAAAALMLNYFVDYRGGASSRPGTKWVNQAYKSATDVRLIGFQASSSVSYMLEFGDLYIRFYANGAPILETAQAITAATQANPGVITVNGHGYLTGDWVYIISVGGMTQLNGKYYRIIATTTNTFTLGILLDGSNLNTTGYGAYTAGGTVQRIYTLASPYAAADLSLLKYAQNVSTMTICHPSYLTHILTLIAAANWTISPIAIGSTVSAPTGQSVATTLSAGSVNYAYVVTAVDFNGQESASSAFATLASKTDLRTVVGTNTISWTAVSGAQSYNVYKAQLSYAGAVPAGTQFGYVGNVTGVNFIDSNIDPDYSTTPPIVKNPFQGAGVASTVVGTPGTYTTDPTITFDAAPSGGQTATGIAVLQVQGTPTAPVAPNGANYAIGDSVTFPNGVVLIVATLNGFGGPATYRPITYPGSNAGNITSGATPTNPVASTATSGSGTGGAKANFVWGVGYIQLTSAGAGYLAAPAITFSSGAAAATATLAPSAAGNPSVPVFNQQRLVLAAPTNNPCLLNFSQPGSYYNYNISFPVLEDNAITASLVSGQLNSIKAMIPMPSGLFVLSDRQGWIINGGSQGSPITPISITANAQAYNGANDVKPIVANDNILYVQQKGSVVRNLNYNFYTNVYTGTDISVLSSHLFYGYQILDWAWAEEPFKIAWAVRDDGVMLALTFLKEQELIGWTHSTTTGGLFKSVATITESVSSGNVDAVYTVVSRTINSVAVKYIERFAERIFPNGVTDAWCVDAGVQYNGAPATSFTGGDHLAGATVTGLADGAVIAPFTMPTNGNFTLAVAASKVTVGLGYNCDLQTLQLDLGEPTVQGKRKKISAVTVRVQETLGLWIGQTSASIVAMKDLVSGNVGSATNSVVSGLQTCDARTIIDPSWNVPGQYFIRQPYPLPASILGVIPEIVVGDK